MSLIGIALVYVFLVGGVLALVVWGVGSGSSGPVSDAPGATRRGRGLWFSGRSHRAGASPHE